MEMNICNDLNDLATDYKCTIDLDCATVESFDNIEPVITSALNGEIELTLRISKSK